MENTLKNYLQEFELHEEVLNSTKNWGEIEKDYDLKSECLKYGMSEEEFEREMSEMFD